MPVQAQVGSASAFLTNLRPSARAPSFVAQNEGNFADKRSGCCKVQNKGLAEPRSSNSSKKAERSCRRTRAAADSAAAMGGAHLQRHSLCGTGRGWGARVSSVPASPPGGASVHSLPVRSSLLSDLSSSCGSQDFLGLSGGK